MEQILDPGAISKETYEKVFTLKSLMTHLSQDASLEHPDNKFLKGLATNKEAAESIDAIIIAMLVTTKELNRMRTAFASAIYLGYQLAQAQLAELPVKSAS